MPVTAEDIRIIKDSLPLVGPRIRPASEQFYENLFSIAPELRPLFRADLAGQGMRFFSTLATICDLLDEPGALTDEIADLARAHAGVGVRPEHFKALGAALVVTLGETLAPDFTCEMARAWHNAFDEIADRMIAIGAFA
ncbi:globin domain-containing protein [Amaricoccus sp.]|uniref:globin domain-containing protein n=1 Tax=Amaricoccus sp. TaxID=1872485 RepID=UPI00261C57F0|nr:globin domain-containing protein [uncultured Amaricoccus sp.]